MTKPSLKFCKPFQTENICKNIISISQNVLLESIKFKEDGIIVPMIIKDFIISPNISNDLYKKKLYNYFEITYNKNRKN
jgi:hypothetical protein